MAVENGNRPQYLIKQIIMHIKNSTSRLTTSSSENDVAITSCTSIYISQSPSMENLRSEPTLTIQVNQNEDNTNNIGNIKQIASSSEVKIVSCFRSTTVNSSVNSVNCVSVHKDENIEKSDGNENKVCIKGLNKIQTTSACEDLNEITVDQVLIDDNSMICINNSSNLDKTDKVEQTTSTKAGVDVITTHSDVDQEACSESVKNRNLPESQTSREQRRRERRERRHARNRAQHVHIPVHQNHTNQRPPANRHGHLRQNYEILPDLSQSNNMPPPYTTLPLHSTLGPSLPSIIAPGPVDDCRFAFPIPVIRR